MPRVHLSPSTPSSSQSETSACDARSGSAQAPEREQQAGALAGLLSQRPTPRTSPRIALPSADPHGPDIRADQAGYLFIRAANKRHVEGSDLADLQRGQQALEATRNALPYGRSNVKGDSPLAPGLLSTLRKVTLPRAKADADINHQPNPTAAYVGVAAGVASFLGAGNCGEHAVLSAASLGEVVEPKEVVRLVQHDFLDHQWAHLSRYPQGTQEPRDDVVVDAWADGPAIFASDGELSQPGSVKIVRSLKSDAAKVAFATAKNTHEHLAATTSPSKEMQAFYKTGESVSKPRSDPRPVLDQLTSRFVLDQLNDPKEIPLVTSEDGVEPKTFIPAQARLNDNKVELRKEILAAGVARSLGANVSDAAKVAPEVIDAAVRLSDWEPEDV